MKNIFSILFSNFKFSADALAESPIPQDVAENVVSGLDAVVKQNGEIVAFATDVSVDENFNQVGIKTLGYHGDRGFKSTDYTCRLTVGTFVVRKKSSTGTESISVLKVSTRKTILTDAPSDFDLLDNVTGVVLMRVKGCRIDSKSSKFQAGQLVNKNTTWLGREVVNENVAE